MASSTGSAGKKGIGAATNLVRTLSDPKKTKRLMAVGKVAVPVLAPLAMKGMELLRHTADTRRAAKLGVDVDRVAAYRGPTGRTRARIDATAHAVDELRARRTGDAAVTEFAQRTERTLADLASAVVAATPMPAARRRSTLAAVDAELDRLESELISHLVRTGA